MQKTYSLVCVSVLLSSTYIKAQDVFDLSLEQLMETKITVNAIEAKPLSLSPATVSIITENDISRYGYKNIADAIETVSGFDVLRTFSINRIATARGILQDNYSNKILLMINDIPIWSAITGFTILDRISINQIKQIEVLKGAASVQYGTNAYTGVINLVLKNTEVNLAQLTLSLGSDDYHYINLQKSINWEDGYFYGSLNYEDESGQYYDFTDAANNNVQFNDKDHIANITGIFKHKSHKLTFNQFELNNTRFGISATATRGGGLEQEIIGRLLNYAFNFDINDLNKLNFTLTYDESGRTFFRTQNKSIYANTLGKRYNSNLKWLNYFKLSSQNRHIFELGLDIDKRESNKYNNIDSTNSIVITENNLADRSIIEKALFSRLNLNFEELTFNLGARITENQEFGTNDSYSLSGLWTASKNHTWRLHYSESYRAPSLFELYFKTDSNSVIGNINLHPETSEVIELGFNYNQDSLSFNSTLYHAKYHNKIFRNSQSYQFESGDFLENTSVYQNGNTITSAGLESELKYQNKTGLSAFLNFNWIDGDKGDQVKNSYNFKYVPKVTSALGISKSFDSYNTSILLNYRHHTQDAFKDIDRSITLDLNLSYQQQFSPVKLNHNLKFENITNETPKIAEYVRRNGADPLKLELETRIYYQLEFIF